MAKKGHDPKGENIHFRQSASSFKGNRQAQTYAKIARSIPYRVFSFSRGVFSDNVQKINRLIERQGERFKSFKPKEKIQ